MRIKRGGWAVLTVLALALAGCAAAEIEPGIAPPERAVLEARTFPEIELATTGGKLHVCKLARLGKDAVSFLPLPYWNVDMKSVAVAEIYSLRLLGK